MNAPLPSPGISRLSPVSRGGAVLDFDPIAGRHAGGAKLECGLLPAVNEHLERAHRHTLGWVVDMGLVEAGGRAFERFGKSRFTSLAARTYPEVAAEQLELISDWITFLFFYDDMCDTQEATDPGYLDKLMVAEQRLIEIGFGAPARAGDSPLDLALIDIRERAAAIAGPAWLARLGGHIREYIEGVRWERVIRLQRQVPSLATYSRLRLLISAVFPCFDFAGMCIDGARSDFADNVLVAQLEVMATNYICWVNDIYGVDKELAEDTTSNIVVVLAHERDLDWHTALDDAIQMCNAELEAFLSLEDQLARLAEPSCRAYVEALKSWMRGNLDWYAETKRYTANQRSPQACWSSWTSWRSVA